MAEIGHLSHVPTSMATIFKLSQTKTLVWVAEIKISAMVSHVPPPAESFEILQLSPLVTPNPATLADTRTPKTLGEWGENPSGSGQQWGKWDVQGMWVRKVESGLGVRGNVVSRVMVRVLPGTGTGQGNTHVRTPFENEVNQLLVDFTTRSHTFDASTLSYTPPRAAGVKQLQLERRATTRTAASRQPARAMSPPADDERERAAQPTQQPTEHPRHATRRKARRTIVHYEAQSPRLGDQAPQKREGGGRQGRARLSTGPQRPLSRTPCQAGKLPPRQHAAAVYAGPDLTIWLIKSNESTIVE
ncbi:hypothetical protein BJ912DRAFT_937149 [Pholiota molesta]|nr:hypothetical protein BJ912DRAFT_937149 [Pholiota molesta]